MLKNEKSVYIFQFEKNRESSADCKNEGGLHEKDPENVKNEKLSLIQNFLCRYLFFFIFYIYSFETILRKHIIKCFSNTPWDLFQKKK
jgi:hypothetical protein